MLWRIRDSRLVFVADRVVEIDIVVWAYAMACTGGADSWLFPLMILRAADHVRWGVRRVVALGHLSTLIFLALILSQHQWSFSAVPATLWGKLVGVYTFNVYLASGALGIARLNQRLRQARHELRAAKEAAEAASRAKSAFLATMSHELRTPLNAIIGFTRIVMRRCHDRIEALQYENLEKILSSGQHLLALINSVLDLSKIEAGRIDVRPSELTLGPVLEQCLRTVEPLIRAEAVKLVSEFAPGLPRIFADEEKLRQIVINLLSNAAKFTDQGTICLHARAANGSVAIAVVDTGAGIPADKLEAIFEEFEQVDSSSTRVHGGTGLGLAIARRLARLMGGDISADSVRGQGSTFTLALPVSYRPPET